MTEPTELRQHVGGGNIAAVCRLSPYQTELEVFLEWHGKMPPHDLDKQRFFRNRKRAEIFINQTLVDEYGVEITAINQRYQDAEFPWAKAELDVQCKPFRGATRIESKSGDPRAAKRWGTMEHDESIPLDVICQVQWGFGVVPGDGALVVAQIGWDDTRLLPVTPDQEIIVMARAKAKEFYDNHILTGIPPAPVSVNDALLLFPRSIAKPILATPEVEAALREMAQLDLDADKLEARKEQCSTLVRAYMGDCDILLKEGMGQLATYRSNKQSIKIEKDELIAAYEAELVKHLLDAAVWIKAERDKVSSTPVPNRPLRNLTKKK